jgi:nitrogen-specific signal transduction histidine kinase/CheY-like chemotaxis protein
VTAAAPARQQTATTRETHRLLRDAQITALGILAASVVEDLRAPLAAIAIGLKEQDRLVAELKAAEAARVEVAQLAELTAEAHAAVRRARDVTARLVAAVEQTPWVPIDVANVARDALDVVRQAFDERGVALEASVDKGCGVRGRPDELTHLVAAMLDNALDAADGAADAGGGRRVRLTVRDETVRVVVAVEDSGAGVPADLRGKIFDPFFSTKTGRIGIGLTMCRQTVLAHKGHLELTRSVDLGGACFRVVLPSAHQDGRASLERQLTTPPLGLPALGRPRVVWIDDEEMFLSSMRRGLPEWDLRTGTTAADGERLVLELSPMVVFCDLGLPDRGGHELHASIATKDPELARRFVFVTGGVITPEIADYLIASGCLTLLKPVRLEEIRALVDGRVADAAPLSARTLREQPSVPPPHKRRTAPPEGG